MAHLNLGPFLDCNIYMEDSKKITHGLNQL
jgi:hypothetical protein